MSLHILLFERNFLFKVKNYNLLYLKNFSIIKIEVSKCVRQLMSLSSNQ